MLFFSVTVGVSLIPISILGLLIVITYTKVLNKHPWLCFIAPGLGFAVLMPIGTFVVQTGEWQLSLFAITLVPFLITNNLLLINQFPDITADKNVGRNHLAIHYGVRSAQHVFTLSLIIATGCLVYLVSNSYLPTLALIALLPLGLCVISLVYLYHLGDNIAQHQRWD